MGRIRYGGGRKRTEDPAGAWSERPYSPDIAQLLEVTESDNIALVDQNGHRALVLSEKYMWQLRDIIQLILSQAETRQLDGLQTLEREWDG